MDGTNHEAHIHPSDLRQNQLPDYGFSGMGEAFHSSNTNMNKTELKQSLQYFPSNIAFHPSAVGDDL